MNEKTARSLHIAGNNLRRFWGAVFTAAAVSALLIANVWQGGEDDMGAVLCSAAVGFAASFCAANAAERFGRQKWMRDAGNLLAFLLGAALLALFCLGILTEEIAWYPAAAAAAALMLLGAFWQMGSGREAIHALLRCHLTAFSISGLFAVVVFCGLTVIFATADVLLDISIMQWNPTAAIVCFLFGFPVGYLAQLGPDAGKTPFCPRLLRALVRWAGIPIAAIYIGVLYLYCGRILITAEWPEGVVAPLALGALLVGGVLYMLARDVAGRIEQIYCKVYPIASVPILIILLMAAGIRISAYGLTEARYYILLCGAAAVVFVVLALLRKGAGMRLLPLFLAGLLLMSILPGTGARSCSYRSQLRRIREAAPDIAAWETLTAEQQRELCRAADYLVNMGLEESAERALGTEIWQILSDAEKRETIGAPAKQMRYFYNRDISVDVAAYDRLIDFESYTGRLKDASGETVIVYDEASGVLTAASGSTSGEIHMSAAASQLCAQYDYEPTTYISGETAIFDSENGRVRIVIDTLCCSTTGAVLSFSGKILIAGSAG